MEIDAALSQFSQDNEIRIEKNYHAWPSRSLEWKDKNIEKKMEISLQDEKRVTYGFWLCAWQDKPDGRYWKNIFVKKNIPFLEIKINIQQLLGEGYKTLESWTEKDLSKSVDLTNQKSNKPWRYLNIAHKFSLVVGFGGLLAIIFINNFTGYTYDFAVIGWIFGILFLAGLVGNAVILIKNTYKEEAKKAVIIKSVNNKIMDTKTDNFHF